MRLLKRIFDKFHKVKFGEVYSWFKSNGMLENLKNGEYRYAVIRLQNVLKSNPELLDMWVFDKNICKKGVVGPKVKELLKLMIRKYHWNNNIYNSKVEQIDIWA